MAKRTKRTTRPRTDLRSTMAASARATATTAARAAATTRPGRVETTNINGYFAWPVKKTLRKIAFHHDTTIQALLGEALNDLFAKYGEPEAVTRPARRAG
jgi:hypothetical protein